MRHHSQIEFTLQQGPRNVLSVLWPMIEGSNQGWAWCIFQGPRWTSHKGVVCLTSAPSVVQEDLCIMQHVNGKLVFTSAAVFFPMRWFFMDKIGREMDGIHSPVPFYQEDLKRPVDNFMGKGLKAGRPFERSNWMVTDDPELRQVGLCSASSLATLETRFHTWKNGHVQRKRVSSAYLA